MNKQTIFVSSYPKSGSTWLTRLLGDILNSPTGGSHLSQDTKEIASEGHNRTGSFFVRKGHYRLLEDAEELNPGPHLLAPSLLKEEKIVFLVRDPRDICISGSFHWNITPQEFLERMIRGDVARVGRWDSYVRDWLNLTYPYGSFASVRYEDLLESTFEQAKRGLDTLRIGRRGLHTRAAIENQSFETLSKRIPLEEHKRNNLRKGIVGDYKNHFTPEMNNRVWKEFGWMMERLGYEH